MCVCVVFVQSIGFLIVFNKPEEQKKQPRNRLCSFYLSVIEKHPQLIGIMEETNGDVINIDHDESLSGE